MPRVVDRKSLILAAAATLFAEKGYEATTIAAVARAGGSSIGSLLHFFPTKAQLALDVRDSVEGEVALAVRTALERHAHDIAKAIESAIAAYLAWAATNSERMVLLRELVGVRVEGRQSDRDLLADVSAALQHWASPLSEATALQALEPAQLLAVILGPAIALTWTCRAKQLHELAAPELAQALAAPALKGVDRMSAVDHRTAAKRARGAHKSSPPAAKPRPPSAGKVGNAVPQLDFGNGTK